MGFFFGSTFPGCRMAPIFSYNPSKVRLDRHGTLIEILVFKMYFYFLNCDQKSKITQFFKSAPNNLNYKTSLELVKKA